MRIGPVGIWEILIILVVVLLIFGPRRLPEMAKGIGQSVREFRKGFRDMKNEFETDDEAGSDRPRADATSRSAAPARDPASTPPSDTPPSDRTRPATSSGEAGETVADADESTDAKRTDAGA